MKLADWLKKHKITPTEFGRRIGVESPSTTARYARGERVPRPSIMKKIIEETKGQVQPNDFHEAA